MFNFTTQTVFNNIVKATDAQVKSGAVKGANVITSTNSPAIRIGNTRFDAAKVESIQIKKPTPEALASVTFDMSDIVIPQASTETEVTGRIAISIKLSMNSQDSTYANAFVRKGKPFFVEFSVKKGDTAAAIAAKVVANAKKYMLFSTDTELLHVTRNEGNVTFEGVNGYQIIAHAALQKWDPQFKSIDCCAFDSEFVDVTVGVPVLYTIEDGAVVASTKKMAEDGSQVSLGENEVAILPGLEAFGDYNWIIHNLRLPTDANFNFWSASKPEMPAVGNVYTQFCIRMAATVEGIGGMVVGERNTSVTDHILYVAGDADVANTPANIVKTALVAAFGSSKIHTDADVALIAPFGEIEADVVDPGN